MRMAAQRKSLLTVARQPGTAEGMVHHLLHSQWNPDLVALMALTEIAEALPSVGTSCRVYTCDCVHSGHCRCSYSCRQVLVG